MENSTETLTLETLLEKGLDFTIDNTGWRKRIRKAKKYHIGQPKLGTLLNISIEQQKFDVDFDKLSENPLGNSFKIVAENTEPICRIVAIAVLNDKDRIDDELDEMAEYFKWKMNPSELWQLAQILTTLCNTVDFIRSIRSFQGLKILTNPKDLNPKDHGD